MPDNLLFFLAFVYQLIDKYDFLNTYIFFLIVEGWHVYILIYKWFNKLIETEIYIQHDLQL